MGYARKRISKDGKTRYTAVYVDHRGRTRSAGTFSSRRDADRAWQAKEAELRQGKVGDPSRGRMTLRTYALDKWLPHHRIEPKTREKYTGCLHKHILPELGAMRMIEIYPEHIRAWIAILQNRNVSPWVIQYCKGSVLNALFTTALNDRIIHIHPCRGVKIPTVPITPRTIITPEQFDVLYKALKDPVHRLLVETDIETGLRWGELIELRVKDLDLATRMLSVSRKATEISPNYHPEGKRFLITNYPKDKEFRRLKLSKQITKKLKAHIAANGLGPEDLLFTRRPEPPPPVRLHLVPAPGDLGLTPPNARGHQYRHGTISAYNAAPCRCHHCRAAYAHYRAERRAAGKDRPRVPKHLQDEHISANWFRTTIWQPALKAAGLEVTPRLHDLRHSHASWLLHGGADLQVVKERLGHASIITTQKYLHTLPEADDTAIDAFTKVRKRSKKSKKHKQQQKDAS
ncbi:tyrosine-type recombinase/integrase [Thermomonospora amylolytica]|uniref:tyrosine-type recombinase/integrase n=1 Tax=Thermomonospora amylolytica TaxID=1411117 RepID=UPI000E6C1A83|nr:site-specific integrase [Thermomonospora amylolytica]